MNIIDFQKKKQNHEKIVMVTCYDAPTAEILERSDIDCILVGDSVSMVVHGFDNTTFATMDMMCLHTEAVARKIKSKFIVGDLPFLSYRKSLEDTMHNVHRLMNAGAHAVKLEGVYGNEDIISHIVESGVPVMGHIGLTPQSIHQLGGNRVQGRNKEVAEKLLHQAFQLEEAGAFCIVLECVPDALAKKITGELNIPTIGIGAGPNTNGQVLVFHDLIGLTSFTPKFLKKYANTAETLLNAINHYALDVKDKVFPDILEHTY